MKTQVSIDTVPPFSAIITKIYQPKSMCVDKGTESAEETKKLGKAEVKQIYYRISETKAAFAERTLQSLKIMLYQNMEFF